MTIQELITATAQRYGISPDLALAVARKESNFNQGARGTSGEIGVFQLMPGTAAGLGVNPSDLDQNVDGGVRYLRQMLDHYQGDTELALAAYNGGPGNVDRGTISSAAWGYARDILTRLGLPTTPSPRRPQLAGRKTGRKAPTSA